MNEKTLMQTSELPERLLAGPAQNSAPSRVLLIGIDGVRPDMLVRAETPNLDALAALGGFKEMQIDDRGISISGPMWSTILTGTWPSEHGVMDNHDEPAQRVPDVFTRLRRAGASHMPVAVASWPPLTSRTGCGPVIDPSEVRTYTAPLVSEHAEDYIEADRAVRDTAVAWLGLAEVDAAFVYFGIVDEIGHSHGVGRPYTEAIQLVDSQVGDVLRVLGGRADRAAWAVLVTTDHGHLDAGGHGGRTLEECAVWALSDRAELLAQIHAPNDLSPAIERLYGVS